MDRKFFFLNFLSLIIKGVLMIVLSRLNGEQFALNCDLIETMQTNHDTIIRLSNGNSYIVSETVDEIIEKIKEYRKSVFSVIVNSAFEN